MTFKKNQSGFTLIELLVVIAIIGILASVVLASLNSARTKGNDAKIKAQLSNARAAAEIYYSDAGNYGTATASCNQMFANASSGLNAIVVGTNAVSPTVQCSSSGTAWAIAANLGNGAAWCVDSTGTSRGTMANGATYGAANSAITSSACN